eukprot:9488677-Pyramimonas_sp.AAC.1
MNNRLHCLRNTPTRRPATWFAKPAQRRLRRMLGAGWCISAAALARAYSRAQRPASLARPTRPRRR